nr:MAG TPA: hypothetical protein [Caudoviricetes sp.]
MREILHCLNILLFIIFYKKSSKSLTYLSRSTILSSLSLDSLRLLICLLVFCR